MTKKEVNLAIINGLKAKEINIAEIELNHLEAFADIMYKAITVTHCCKSDSDQCCDETRKINQFLKRPSKYCMTCSKELK